MKVRAPIHGKACDLDLESGDWECGSRKGVLRRQYRRAPSRLYLKFSDACNLSCPYCFQGSHYVNNSGWVPVDECLEVVCSQLNSFDELFLFGGEPFVPTNRKILEAFFERDFGLPVFAFTNGCFGGWVLDLLERYRDRIGCVVITIDGPKDVQDRMCPLAGSSSYDAAVSNVSKLLDASIPIQIQINVSKENACRVAGLVEELSHFDQEKLSYTINPLKYVKNSLSTFELIDLFYGVVSNIRNVSINLNLRLYNNLIAYLSERPMVAARCDLAKTMVLDFPRGIAYACPQNESTRIGKILGGRPPIVQRLEIAPLVDEVEFLREPCSRCWLSDFCPFNCPFDRKDYEECREVVRKGIERVCDGELRLFEGSGQNEV